MAAAQPLPSLEILVRDQDRLSIWTGPPFDNGEPVTKLQKVACESAVFCKNGSRLMVVNSKGAISVFDCKTCKEIRLITVIQVSDLLDADLSPCGTYVQTFQKASSPREHNVNLWEVETGVSIYSLSQKHMTKSNCCENYGPKEQDLGLYRIGYKPTVSFSSDEAIACRLVTNEVQFFDTCDFANGYVSCLKIPRVASLEHSKQPSSHFATYAPEVKGVPASVQIYACGSDNSSQPQLLARRSFFGCSTVKIHWNYGSTGLLFITQSDVDEANQSCVGESKLNYLTTDGIHEGVVPLRKEGPIHDVQWSYSGSKFAVVYGLMPAKATVFDKNCNPILDLGEGPYNTVKWNPNGRVLCLAGFGNLPGDMAFWDCNKKKQVVTATVEGSVTGEWSPDGCYFMTASTAPTCQVDNRIKIFNLDGSLYFQKAANKLFQADWKPESAERLAETSGLGESFDTSMNEEETDRNGNTQLYAEILRLQEAVLALAQTRKNQQENSYYTILDRFIAHHPPTYDGVNDLVVLEEWVRDMEKLFEATRCPEEHMIKIATYYLKGNADNWWTLLKTTMLARPGFNWDQFKESLKKWFYPETLRVRKELEFLDLKQGEMSVQEYSRKFLELGRFAPNYFENEALIVQRFERNLDPEIEFRINRTTLHTVQEAYERALQVYERALLVRNRKRSYESAMSPSQNSAPAKRPNVDHADHDSDSPQDHSECYRECYRCNREFHPGKNCDGSDIFCFVCGVVGHKSYACPQRG